MEFKVRENNAQCRCCKACRDCAGFKRILDTKKTGLAIYQHTTCMENINKSSGILESNTDIANNVYIIQNSTDIEIKDVDIVEEFEKQITCPRCQKILEYVRRLLINVKSIGKNELIGICNHCRFKKRLQQPCNECDAILRKFSSTYPNEKDSKRRVKAWLPKNRKFLDGALESVDKQETNLKRRVHSDFSIDKIYSTTTQKVHEPHIGELLYIDTQRVGIYGVPLPTKKKQLYFLEPLQHPKRDNIRSTENIYDDDDEAMTSQNYKKNMNDDERSLRSKKYNGGEDVDKVAIESQKYAIGIDDENLLNRSQIYSDGIYDDEQVIRPQQHNKGIIDDQMAIRSQKYQHKDHISSTETLEQAFEDHLLESKGKIIVRSKSIPSSLKQEIEDEYKTRSKKYPSQKKNVAGIVGKGDDDLEQAFSYAFIKVPVEKVSRPKHHLSSSTLIKNTKDMLEAKAEVEKNKTEEEENRKREQLEKQITLREEKRRKVAEQKIIQDEKIRQLNEIEHTEKDEEKVRMAYKREKDKKKPDEDITKKEKGEQKNDKDKGKQKKDNINEHTERSIKEKEDINKYTAKKQRVDEERIKKEELKLQQAEQLQKEKDQKKRKTARPTKTEEKINHEDGKQMKYDINERAERLKKKKEDHDKDITNKQRDKQTVDEERITNDELKRQQAELLKKEKVPKEMAKKEGEEENRKKEEVKLLATDQLKKVKEKEAQKSHKDMEEEKKKKEILKREHEETLKNKDIKHEQVELAKKDKEITNRLEPEKKLRENDLKKPKKEVSDMAQLKDTDIAPKEKDQNKSKEDILAEQMRKMVTEQRSRNTEVLKLKREQIEEEKRKETQLKNNKQKTDQETGLSMKTIVPRRLSDDDLILRLVKIRQQTGQKITNLATVNMTPADVDEHIHNHKNSKYNRCIMCIDSDISLDIRSLTEKQEQSKYVDVIIGDKIKKRIAPFHGEDIKEEVLLTEPIKKAVSEPKNLKLFEDVERKQKSTKESNQADSEIPKGIIRYSLSDRTFIEKGWTMLPTEKVVRKMNVYRMRPAHPEFDWFEHNKNKRLMQYDSGERLAEFDDNGRGRWYYRNGRLALDYYDAEEINAQQRFVIYSNGEPDERGRSRPITILATFDYLGNGIVFDHKGKIRLKFNQTEGVVLDRSLGPVSHWKWHTLNDPPVLQQVMIDTQLAHKDPEIVKFGGTSENKPRLDNEEMLAIEFDNFIKEKSKKLSQKFKPFQIKMKALKINEHFSLRVLDQATIYLIFRDGTTSMKLNIGMVLDHHEIVDTDTAELGEVSNSIERLPARTDSIANLQRSVAHAQRVEKAWVERERRLRPPEPCGSADALTAASSRPLQLPLHTMASTSTATNVCKCVCPKATNLYYDTRII